MSGNFALTIVKILEMWNDGARQLGSCEAIDRLTGRPGELRYDR